MKDTTWIIGYLEGRVEFYRQQIALFRKVEQQVLCKAVMYELKGILDNIK